MHDKKNWYTAAHNSEAEFSNTLLERTLAFFCDAAPLKGQKYVSIRERKKKYCKIEGQKGTLASKYVQLNVWKLKHLYLPVVQILREISCENLILSKVLLN